MNKFIILLSLSLFSLTANAEKLYTFGIVPQQSASKLAKLWGPIFQDITEKTGIKLKFATATDIPTFEKRLSEGAYDFAYMNPYHFTVFNETPGYRALAKAKDKRIKGIIVVKKDSGINELQQLNDSKMAFPSPAAFAASILTRAHLAAIGVKFTPNYVSSHDSVYLTVAKGLYKAGGGVMRTFNNMDEATRSQLKVLWTSDGFTPHAIAAHPDIDDETANLIQDALIKMEETPEGLELLSSIKLKGFVAAKDSDWDDVRALKIDLLDDL
ncbi:MAG: phosphate/phosphite/phosphonate ABC transporter substrate-binding protein [Gammaproteobacteria bacterium]|jgi:phosphonate transport system substrate-binding protein